MIAVVLAVAAATHADVEAVVKDMTFPGMSVSVEYLNCGFINAAYFPVEQIIWWGESPRIVHPRTVILCNETLPEGVGFTRFIVAHEMAHAIVDQYRIPTTGSEEAAADELAAVIEIAGGHRDDIVTTS